MINQLFAKVKNVEAVEDTILEHGAMQKGRLHDLDTERWNSLAERTNTASFIRMTGKQPKDYAEVRCWVKGLVHGEPEDNKKSRRSHDSFTISVG